MFAFKLFQPQSLVDAESPAQYDHKAQVWMTEPVLGESNPMFFGTLASSYCSGTGVIKTGYPNGSDLASETGYDYD